MATYLPDHEIRRILADVVLGGSDECINPNGIELRLGNHVKFYSTREERQLKTGQYLRVGPGESVLISSLEKLDFSESAVRKRFPKGQLMGWITPTTTMMREGISQVATKVDAGFRGNLNWMLRNGSSKELIVGCGEPIFKLTMLLLDESESPSQLYGKGRKDQYQDSEGLSRSQRRIPTDIADTDIVGSSFDKLDPKKQLREAGYPFDHIGRELTDLHGRFEMVSKDVLLLKDQFAEQTRELSAKIASETGALVTKIDETKTTFVEKIDQIFQEKFVRTAGWIIGAIPVMYAGVTFLQNGTSLASQTIAWIACVAGIVVIAITMLLTKKSSRG
jgi:deoxycytidine triphosphate deaminase